jgi:hypothetical protein
MSSDALLAFFFDHAEIFVFGAGATIMVMRRLRSKV